MKLLLDKENIIFIGDVIEYGIYDEPIKKWKIEYNGMIWYAIDNDFIVADVGEETLPNGVDEGRYCYNEKDGFYLNPNYVEPYDIESEVKRLTKENETLKTTVSNLENSTVEGEIETDLRLSMLELGLA